MHLSCCQRDTKRSQFFALRLDKIDVNGPSNVLQGSFSLIAKLHLKLVADLVADDIRAGNSTGRSETLQARGDVNALAIDIVALNQYVAYMNTHAKAQVPDFGQARVARRHTGLDFHCTAKGIDDARELDQKAIARHLENPPAVARHRRIQKVAPVLAQNRECSFLIGLHKPTVADNVCCQYRSKAAFYLVVAHVRPRGGT